MNRGIVVAIVTLLSSGLAFSQGFTVVAVPGASPDSLIAINNSGKVAVNTGTSQFYQASTWSRSAGSQSVGLIGTDIAAAAINNSGSVVGAGDPDQSGNLLAFVSQPSGSVQWLGSLGGNLTAASGINNSGAVVGLSYTATNKQHAFFWTPAAGMQDLTPDLSSIGGGTAVGINSSNQVVGYYFPNGSLNTLGFLWTQAAGRQNLGSAGTLAFAISDSGTVVGQSQFANAYRHAFSWTHDGGIKDLGTLGGPSSSALGINSRGWIVGTSITNSGNGLLHGFLWTPSAGMQDFTALAGLSPNQQVYSVQMNDFGVIAISTNKGDSLLIPTMTSTVTSSANPSALGTPVTLTATLTSIVGAPPDGETVQFAVSGVVMGSAPLQGGVAKFTTSAIPAGSRVVTAKYSGDANYLPAKNVALTQVINK